MDKMKRFQVKFSLNPSTKRWAKTAKKTKREDPFNQDKLSGGMTWLYNESKFRMRNLIRIARIGNTDREAGLEIWICIIRNLS